MLNDDSFIKDLPNTKYFNFLFSVNGSNICLTFSAENLDSKFDFFKLINGILKKLKEKKENKLNLLKKTTNLVSQELILSKVLSTNAIPIKVNVIGTEERNYSTFGRYTVYIIEIKLNEFSQRIYLRYSEMIHLYNLVKKHFPLINAPKITKTHWFTYRKTKIIESRKMLIENFLQNILKNENIISDCAKILSFLNLPLDLYEVHLNQMQMANSNMEISQTVSAFQLLKKYSNSKESDKIMESQSDGIGKFFKNIYKYLKILMLIEENKSEDMNNTLFFNNSLYSSHSNVTTPKKNLSHIQKSSSFLLRNQRQTVHKLKEMSRIQNDNFWKEIKVNFVDGSSTKLKINVNTTAEDAIEKIANLIHLKNSLDFRLFMIDEYDNKKMIDDDELLFKFFCDDKAFQKIKWEFDSRKIHQITSIDKKNKKKDTFFYQIKKKLSNYLNANQIFSKEKEVKLLFKKYFFLDQKLEKEGFYFFI